MSRSATLVVTKDPLTMTKSFCLAIDITKELVQLTPVLRRALIQKEIRLNAGRQPSTLDAPIAYRDHLKGTSC